MGCDAMQEIIASIFKEEYMDYEYKQQEQRRYSLKNFSLYNQGIKLNNI
jgi:hypothetical protein